MMREIPRPWSRIFQKQRALGLHRLHGTDLPHHAGQHSNAEIAVVGAEGGGIMALARWCSGDVMAMGGDGERVKEAEMRDGKARDGL